MEDLSMLWALVNDPVLGRAVWVLQACVVYVALNLTARVAVVAINAFINHYATHSLKKSHILPTLHIDSSFVLTIESIVLSEGVMKSLNKTLHYNCQFEVFSIKKIQIRVIPYIHLEVDGVTFKGYALPPSQWSMEGVMDALKQNRLKSLDEITRRIYKVLYRSFKVTKLLENVMKSMFLKVLHCVDIVIGTAYCDIRNVNASFCAVRSFTDKDITVLAHIGLIEVKPSSSFSYAFYSPMFKMGVKVEDVSLTSRYISNDELAAPPMLAPLTVAGFITLPKILSQMIRKEALPSKYCHLDLKAPHAIVDLGKVNTQGLMNFSLAIIYYRMWYTGVMAFYEKTLEISTSPDIDPQTALTNYVALYSNYAQLSGYKIHIDQSKSIFGLKVENNTDPVFLLRQKCRRYEEVMSTDEVIHARVLALGWKEEKETFRRRLNIEWSDDSDKDFFKTMKDLYEREALAHKEMRNIKVNVKADQVDFLLSTPRTTESRLHMDMTNYPVNSVSASHEAEPSTKKDSKHNGRRFTKRLKAPPPVMFSVCGIDLMVVDPIVPAAYPFDKVRDVIVEVRRMRIGAPTSRKEQIPTSEYCSLDQTIVDVYDVIDEKSDDHIDPDEDGENDYETHPESMDIFENASCCEDLASIPRLKSEKTIYATEKVHTRVLNANSFHVGQRRKVFSKSTSISAPMVYLNIHEDPGYEILAVEAILSNALIVIDVSNILEIAEYSLDIVQDVSFSLQRWSTSVDILEMPRSPTSLPTSLLKGKRLKIAAKCDGLGLGIQEPSFKGSETRSKLFLYRFNTGIYMMSDATSESISGFVESPIFSTCELERGLTTFNGLHRGIEAYNILLRPSTLICNVMDDYRSEFKYSLYKEFVVPPAIFSDDEIKGIKTKESLKDSSRSFYKRKKAESKETQKSNTLFRHIQWKSDPFVVNISEQELNIMVHWLEQSLSEAREGTFDLDMNISRMKSTADALNTNASMEEFTHQMIKIFKANNIDGDDRIYANMLRELFLSDNVRDALLDTELAEHENDLMFLFDPNLKGYTTLNDILSHCRDICGKCSWDPRGNVKMLFKDFSGIRPSAIFSDALHDGAALSNFWALMEEQTKIRRSTGTLADISSAAVQMMLVRLCGDGALARVLWEKIVRNNLKDKNENLHPWVIDDDREILRVPTAGDVIRHKISGTDYEDFIQFTEKSKNHLLMKQRVHLDYDEVHLNDVDMTVTAFDIAAGTIQFNYMDTLLGPLLPRFQVSVSNIYFDGEISHLGLSLDFSFTSNYSLISRLFGGVTLESCFFNSAVSSHEPIIEPFTLEFGAVNIPSDETAFSIHVKDTGKFKLNISSALLETMSSAVFCIIDTSNKNSCVTYDMTSAVPMITDEDEVTLPSFIIINMCGLDLSVQTYVTDLEDDRHGCSDPLNCMSAVNGKVTPIVIPWSSMYRSYSDNCFPEVLVTSVESPKLSASHFFTTGSPVPVHTLSVAKLFLTKEDVNYKSTSVKRKTMRRMQSDRGRRSSFLQAEVLFKPGVVLESKNDHGLDCGIVFVARSNLRIQNNTGIDLSLRADCPGNRCDESSFVIRNLDGIGLPLPLIDQQDLALSFLNSDGSWTKSITLLDLIGCESRRMMIGGYLVYVESTRHYHEKDKMEIFDYTIEIVCGIRLVNVLPYRVEVRYSQDKDHTWMKMSSSNDEKAYRIKIESGDEHLLPINLQDIDNVKFSFRLDSSSIIDSGTTAISKLKFSESIRLIGLFDDDMPNITTEDIGIHFLNPDSTESFRRIIRVKKIRDASKESSYSEYTSTPTLELHADLWIQNNSGIPLFFKFKDSKGRQLEVQDIECGINQISPDECNNQCIVNGPVIGLLDSEKLQIKIDSEREIVSNKVTFQKLTHMKTNVSLPHSVHSGIFKNSSWSKHVVVSSKSIVTGELECDGIWLGISIEKGKGIFSNTNIAVITPRFLIQNKTSLDIDFFPVRLWKRMRKSSTDSETQGMRKLAKSNEKNYQSLDILSDEQITLQAMLHDQVERDEVVDTSVEEKINIGIESDHIKSVDIAGSTIISGKSNTACSFFSLCGGQRSLSNFMNTEYSALAMRINESKYLTVNPLNSITVGIVSASDLASADLLGSSDPFCEVFWQGELIHTTSCLFNTLNPIWNERVHLHIKPEALRMSELRIIVHDRDMGGQKDFLGQVTLKHGDLLSCPGKMFEMCLMHMPNGVDKKKGKSQGKIRLVIDFNRDDSFNTWTAPVPIGHPISEAVSACTSDGDRHLLEVNVTECNSFNIITVSEHTARNLPDFMIVNEAPDFHLRFRQKHTNALAYPRQIVRPMEYLYYAWDDSNLPKVIDLVAVDKYGVESPVETYILENVGKKHPPLNVSMLDNRRTRLSVRVVIEGNTRKLVISNDDKFLKSGALGNPKAFAQEDCAGDVGVHQINFMCNFAGISLSLIDEVPRELIHFTVDAIDIWSLPYSNKIQLTVRHLQLDNMLSDTDYPVVLAPFDAGYNSHLNEDFNYFTKEAIPFLDITLELDFCSLFKDTVIVDYFEMKIQELNLFVDFNFVVKMASSMITPNVIDAMSRISRVVHSRMGIVEVRRHLNDALIQAVVAPKIHSEKRTLMIFFKTLILHSVGVRMTLAVALKKDLSIDPRRIGSQVEYSTIQNLMSLSRGVTNINPHFTFGTISITNAFDTVDGIGWRLAKFYIASAGLQALRLLGSAEIIGDPAGGLLSLGTSIRMFAIKTKSEIDGQAPVRAEGLKHLVQGVASISFGTVSKVANSVGEQLASVTGSDFKSDMAAKNPSHVGKGALQGGSIFFKTCKAGVTNVYKKPMEGYRKRSISKTAKGVVTGISGLALAPIVGALGATAKLTKGIEATAHVFDDKPIGRIRPPRSLFYSPQIRPLEKSVFLVHYSIVIRGADLGLISTSKAPPFYNFQDFDEEDDTPTASPRNDGANPEGGSDSFHRSPSLKLSCSTIASYVLVVHMKYGSQERVSREIPLANAIRLPEKDLLKFDFKVKSKKGKFEHRMLRISICLKPKHVFGMEVTIAKALLHPLDLVIFLRQESAVPLATPTDSMHLETIDENSENIVWQYKSNGSRRRFDRSRSVDSSSGFDTNFLSLTRKNRASHETASVVSDLNSAGGVSVLTMGVSGSKMSQYLQSLIDHPDEHMAQSDKQVISQLNTYVAYPEAVTCSKLRKSFVDNDSDTHTSTKDIFSVDCRTKVAAKKKNMKEIFFLRDFLSSDDTAKDGATPVSSDSASSITMTTPPQSRLRSNGSDIGTTPVKPLQNGFMKDQVELYRVAEALRFKLFLSGSYVSAPSIHN